MAAGHRIGEGNTGQDEEDKDGLVAGPQQVEGALGQEPVERAGGHDSGAGANRGQRRHGLQAVVDEDDGGGKSAQTVELDEPHRRRLARG